MRCSAIHPMIALDVEGDLDDAGVQRLRDHLEECAACRALRDELEASQRALRGLVSAEVQPERLARIRAGVRKRIAPSGRHLVAGPAATRAAVPAARPLARVWAVVAATLVLGLVLVALLPRWSERTAQTTSAVQSMPTPAPPAGERAAPLVPLPAEAPLPQSTQQEVAGVETARQSQANASAAVDRAPRAVDTRQAVERPPQAVMPTVVCLVSESSDVVIYWLIESDENAKES
jgi:hypothetical protein